MKKALLVFALLAFVGSANTFAQDGEKKSTTTSTTKKEKKKSGCCKNGGGSTGQTCDKKKETK